VKLIALEEAFAIPGIAEPMPQLADRTGSFAEAWSRKLPDFTEYRLQEMDAAGIDIQVLSLTVPGSQAECSTGTLRPH
jgi:2,3-dihydroxybenzoate decarboxylase